MATEDVILALDYNAIREKVISVMGLGYSQRGYGQAITSNETVIGHTITQEVWNNLRLDLVNILLHQAGAAHPSVVAPLVGQVIRYGESHPVTSYNTLIDNAIFTRFQIGTTRSLVTAQKSRSITSIWSDSASCTAEVEFDSVDKARYFFNAGGKIRFSSSLTSPLTTARNLYWTNLLNSVGLVQFGAATPTLKTYYQLTDTFQIISKSVAVGSAIYAYGDLGYFQISAKCNVPNNVDGTANVITFAFEWKNDVGLYGGDVDGTLRLTMDELKATGPIFPSGDFEIESPLYTLNPITTV